MPRPPPPYIAFAPPLASGTSAARTLALAETLERWRAAVNGGRDGDESSPEPASAFAGVIGRACWHAEWYDVYAVPGGALRTDGRDPCTVLGAPRGASAYVFSMERSACALFGVVTSGVHMTVYERDGEGEGSDGEGSRVRVWIPRRALTKPTCVLCPSRPCTAPSRAFYCTCPHTRVAWTSSCVCIRMCAYVKLPRHARQLGRGRHSWGDDRVYLHRQRGCGGGEPRLRTRAQACARRRRRDTLPSDLRPGGCDPRSSMCMICVSSRARCGSLRWMERLSPLKSVSCPVCFPFGRRVMVCVQLLPLDEVVARMHAGSSGRIVRSVRYVSVSSSSASHSRRRKFSSILWCDTDI